MNPEQITVTVTEEHIKEGARGSSTSCPVALALREQGYLKVNVSLYRALINHEWWHISQELREWIFAYDSRVAVEPGTFFLEVWP